MSTRSKTTAATYLFYQTCAPGMWRRGHRVPPREEAGAGAQHCYGYPLPFPISLISSSHPLIPAPFTPPLLPSCGLDGPAAAATCACSPDIPCSLGDGCKKVNKEIYSAVCRAYVCVCVALCIMLTLFLSLSVPGRLRGGTRRLARRARHLPLLRSGGPDDRLRDLARRPRVARLRHVGRRHRRRLPPAPPRPRPRRRGPRRRHRGVARGARQVRTGFNIGSMGHA